MLPQPEASAGEGHPAPPSLFIHNLEQLTGTSRERCENLKPVPPLRMAAGMNPAGRAQHEDGGIMHRRHSFPGGDDQPHASLKEKNDNLKLEGLNCKFLLASNQVLTPKSTLRIRRGALLSWERLCYLTPD